MKVLINLFAATLLCVNLYAAESERTEVGKKIIDVKLKDLQGKVQDTAELRAGKILVICLSSSGDEFSKKQVTALPKVMADFGDQIVVVNIATREKLTPQQLADQQKQAGSKYIILVDDGAVINKMGLPIATPQVIVADAKGIVVHAGGYCRYEKMKAAIEVAQESVPAPPFPKKPKRLPPPEPPKEEPKPAVEEQPAQPAEQPKEEAKPAEEQKAEQPAPDEQPQEEQPAPAEDAPRIAPDAPDVPEAPLEENAEQEQRPPIELETPAPDVP